MKLITRISSTCGKASCRSWSRLTSPQSFFSNPQIITIRSQRTTIFGEIEIFAWMMMQIIEKMTFSRSKIVKICSFRAKNSKNSIFVMI